MVITWALGRLETNEAGTKTGLDQTDGIVTVGGVKLLLVDVCSGVKCGVGQ
jgi:hypothetical protein